MTEDRLGVLAHELRSPVAALSALAERGGSADVPDALLSRFVTIAIAAGRDVERLLSDPDLLSIQPVEIELPDLLGCVVQPGVAFASERLRLVGDPTRLRQALANLVANGLRHGSHVSIEARRHGDRVVIDVRDDGPGVDPSIDPFARGVSTSGSIGYGLWLARAIVEAHGGELVSVDSSSPRGAEFRLSLPLSSA